MQTHFTTEQRERPDIQAADPILRSCVHCGFCTATCPTYVLLGDENDSPRGRIYLIKEMLERDAPATDKTVKHIDRCLSCLACMTTCPASVHYMHLVDLARERIEETYTRPLPDRLLRRLLAAVMPRPGRFRWLMALGALAKPLAPVMPARLAAALRLAPARLPRRSRMEAPQIFSVEGTRRRRVALLAGCVQNPLAPQINEATVRLLTRLGCEVVTAEGAGCCGSLAHHMGRTEASHAAARANVDAWLAEKGRDLDAVVINASGCGTTVKDYGYMLRLDPVYADKAAEVSALARDVTELIAELWDEAGWQPENPPGLAVTYQSACSMQHGQGLATLPRTLLERAGYTVREPAEPHLCCGSAGVYNIMQPALAGQLRDRKAAAIRATEPEAVATGNIGCLMQLAPALDAPVVHTVELLDWASGGPKPAALG